MSLHRHAARSRAVLLAAGGPIALGLSLGLPLGAAHMLREAALLPALVAGLTLLMAPALYVGLTLVGAAPPAGEVALALATGLKSAGTVMAGLAPAAAFLLATTEERIFVAVFGVLAVATAMLVGLGALSRRLFRDPAARMKAAPIWVAWSLVGLGMGAQLFVSTLGA